MRIERLGNLYLKARGTSMSETLNDYIRRVKAFSTLHGGLHQSRPDLQPPDTPK
jgi:hypothetical protein